MNPDTIQIIENALVASSAILLSITIARLLMGDAKHLFKILLLVVLLVSGALYINSNKEAYIQKYESNLINNILWHRVKDTLKIELPNK